MNSSRTTNRVHIYAILSIVAGDIVFWLSLFGFGFSLVGSFVQYQSEYAFGYAFFGIILVGSLITACVEYRRNGAGDPQSRKTRHEDLD
jgi:hypothetical protein